jgi:DNA-binding CsgD family transcriptional regulator
MERVTVGVALLSALALFMPISQELFSLALYIKFFCCCFMIGFETGIVVNLFTEKCALLHLTAAYFFGFLIPALLQNDFIKTPFWVFRIFAVAACIMQLYFYCKLPGNVWPVYVKKGDGLVCPKSFFGGMYLLEFLTALMTVFGLAIAETITHGIFTIMLSGSVFGLAVYLLWKRFNIAPMRCSLVLLGLAALGFLLAIASLYFPVLSLFACVLLGAGMTAFVLQPMYGVIMAKRYPSRFIASGFIGICFIAILIHTGLLEILRSNPTVMYSVYLIIAGALAVVFYMLMPYLLYNFRSRTLQDIIGVVAEETDDGAAEPVKRAALLVTTETVKAAAPEVVPPHERRMNILMSNAITSLTSREYQLTDCIMRGLRRSEIAKEMDVLPETISTYTKRIYDKFGIHGRSDLFRLAEKLERSINR